MDALDKLKKGIGYSMEKTPAKQHREKRCSKKSL